MNKEEFLAGLKNGLSGLPADDVDERLAFYGEMIDDRVEEGLSEEEAVAGIGSIDDIVSQTVAEIPLARLVKEKIKPERNLGAWGVVLIILGFPLWFGLIIAACAVILSLYITLWSLIIALWAVELSLAAGAIGGIAAAVIFFVAKNPIAAVGALGAGLFCAGAAIFLFFGCAAATKGVIALTKKAALGIKKLFVRKDRVK